VARILLADDEPAVREFVRRSLEHRGHKIVAVADGAEALSVLQQDTQFDLLLTDIVMPVMDGIALALKVAKDYPSLRILLMTGFAAEKARAHNLDFLVHEVVSKPFTMDEIVSRVERALARSSVN
jgi:two-component system cell cycle response regulator CpdR